MSFFVVVVVCFSSDNVFSIRCTHDTIIQCIIRHASHIRGNELLLLLLLSLLLFIFIFIYFFFSSVHFSISKDHRVMCTLVSNNNS